MKRTMIVALCLVFVAMLGIITACEMLPADNGEWAIALSAEKTTLAPGEELQLSASAVKDGEKAEVTFVYELTEGATLATVDSNGLLKVSATASAGVIKVIAKANGVASKELVLNVSIPLTGITISANKTTVDKDNGYVRFTVAFAPEAATADYSWVIVSGEDMCEPMDSTNILSFNANAVTDAVVVVKAVAGEIESNEVSIALTSSQPYTVSLFTENGATTVSKNSTVQFGTTIGSEDAGILARPVAYSIEEGAAYASIDANGLLTVREEAVGGARIVVVGTVGSVSSLPVVLNVVAPLSGLTATVHASSVNKEGYARLSYALDPIDATDANVHWVVTEGADMCNEIGDDNILTFNATAVSGSVIKVKAVSGTIESNEVSITLLTSESFTVSLVSDKQSITKEQSAVLTASINSTDAGILAKTISYEIIAGEDKGSLANNILTFASTARGGDTITVIAKVDNVESRPVTISLDVALAEITASSDKNEMDGNGYAVLSYVILPIDANAGTVSWVFVAGEDIAALNGNILTFSNASIGDIVEIKAVCGAVESNVVSITRVASELERALLYSFEEDRITLDTMDNTGATRLAGTLYDGLGRVVEDVDVSYELAEGGADYVSISSDGTITPIKHGTAIVHAVAEGKTLSSATIRVIMPPVALALPEVFAERIGYEYSIGTKTVRLGEQIDRWHWQGMDTRVDDVLPFVFTPLGNNVCMDYAVSFELVEEDGLTDKTPSEEIATYADGAISFLKKGRIRVNASSTSGSKVEARTSYVFNVNDAINIHDHLTLKVLAYHLPSTGTLAVNLVLLDKITGQVDGPNGIETKEYGYALVSNECLKPISQQSVEEHVFGPYGGRIYSYGRGLTIYGNRYTFDASNTRPILASDNITNEGELVISYTSLLGLANPNAKPGEPFSFGLYDMNFIGDSGIEVDTTGHYVRAVEVGYQTDNAYFVDIKNVNISGFNGGLRVSHALNGLIENIRVDNIYSNGIELSASQITVRDITYGRCGACGIELTPDGCSEAGIKFNENQVVRMEGYMRIASIENGATFNNAGTRYMVGYQGGAVPALVNGYLAAYGATISNHLSSNGSIVFCGMIFNSFTSMTPNSSTWNYANADMNGIITIEELITDATASGDANYKDTEHQFILMQISIPAGGAMGLPAGTPLGTVLVYNLNYQPSAE